MTLTNSSNFAWSRLSKKSKISFYLGIVGQTFFVVLDLLGVLLLGIVGSLIYSLLSGSIPQNQVARVLSFFNLDNTHLSKVIVIILLVAATLFTFKSLGNIFLNWKILVFLSHHVSKTSALFLKQILNASFVKRSMIPNQKLIFALTDSLNSIYFGNLGNLFLIISDLILISLLMLLLCIVDYTMFLFCLAYFLPILFLSTRFLARKTKNINKQAVRTRVQSSTQIEQILILNDELRMRGLRNDYLKRFAGKRTETAFSIAQALWINQLPKYLIEVSAVFGLVGLLGISLFKGSAAFAFSKLAIFLAASSRLTPSLIRMQSLLIARSGFKGSSSALFEILSDLNINLNSLDTVNETDNKGSEGNPPGIIFQDVHFKYPGGSKEFIFDALTINPGEVALFKGPSGMGKTTLVNLLIGNLVPKSGHILVDDSAPIDFIDRRPGQVGYVPQNVQLFEGSLAQNIDLGVDGIDIDLERIRNGLQVSSLDEFLVNFPESAHKFLGELGFGLSGGQKQRLGIARALYSNPGLLVFDEPTSSLDIQNESAFIECLRRINGAPTMMIISHSSSFDVIADRIFHLVENTPGVISLK